MFANLCHLVIPVMIEAEKGSMHFLGYEERIYNCIMHLRGYHVSQSPW